MQSASQHGEGGEEGKAEPQGPIPGRCAAFCHKATIKPEHAEEATSDRDMTDTTTRQKRTPTQQLRQDADKKERCVPAKIIRMARIGDRNTPGDAAEEGEDRGAIGQQGKEREVLTRCRSEPGEGCQPEKGKKTGKAQSLGPERGAHALLVR